MQRGDKLSLFEAQKRFEQSGNTRRRQQMPDVAFDGTDAAKMGPGGKFPEKPCQRPGLHRIADISSRAVRFNVTYGSRINAGIAISFSQNVNLPFGVGRHGPQGVSVVVHSDAPDDTVYFFLFPQRRHQRLQQHHARALAQDGAVSAYVEHPALVAGR